MLVERRERTSWGMRERARMNCLSVCLCGYMLLQVTQSQHCTENGRFLTPETGITVKA